MSGCALRRWGPGTPCNRDADTPASKEMAAALAKMQAERDLQDQMWTAPVPIEVKQIESIEPIKSIKSIQNVVRKQK